MASATTGSRSRQTVSLKDRGQIIRQVTTPLGFYVLTLLILETTLSVVLTWSKLNEDHVWCGFILMIVMFFVVVLIVTAFVSLKPQSLLFEKEQYLPPELELSALKDQIEDLIYTNVKQECLQKIEKGGK